MANKIIGLPAPFLLPCFISGLTPEIRHAVQAHQPMTVDQAVGLAKLQEQQMTNLCLPPHLRPPPPRSTTILPLLPSPPSPPPMVKRLTPEEPTFRRERGMCFTCDERYLRGHYDASKASLLVVEDEDSNSLNTDPVDPTLDLKWSSPFDYQPKSFVSVACSPHTKQNQKRKRPGTLKAKVPTKKTKHNTIPKKKSY